jgi:hypothetical protein
MGMNPYRQLAIINEPKNPWYIRVLCAIGWHKWVLYFTSQRTNGGSLIWDENKCDHCGITGRFYYYRYGEEIENRHQKMIKAVVIPPAPISISE